MSMNCTHLAVTMSPGCWTGERGDPAYYPGDILFCKSGHPPGRFSREAV